MKVMIVFGTRPELIKFVPVIYALRDKHELSVVHTLQHEELTDDILEFFKIKPDYYVPDILNITNRKAAKHHFEGDLPNLMRKFKPHLVIVQGDTLTAFLAALTAFDQQIPVLHLEAGLRTGNRFSPYPEETFRMLITQIAEFHFAPTARAAKELIDINVPRDRVYITGNTVIDAAILTSKILNDDILEHAMNKLCKKKDNSEVMKNLVLVTAHRNENIGKPLKRICQSILYLSRDYPELQFVWLMHRNPKVRSIILKEFSQKPDNICIIEAVSYPLMIWMMNWAKCILTDSGGIQEEATALHVPIIILRDHTERPEVLHAINAYLVGSDIDLIVSSFHSIIGGAKKITHQPSPFGDGKTSIRLKKFLENKEVIQFLTEYPAMGNKIFSNNEEWIKVD
ncbi:MAG: UDP-N-acetylglucosamine 2-epimerase (non-hydrolyzing) [Candidatus Cloacimonadaceae bacterium]